MKNLSTYKNQKQLKIVRAGQVLWNMHPCTVLLMQV